MKHPPTSLPLPKGVRVDHGRYVLFKKVNGKTERTSLTRVEDGRQALDDELAARGLAEIRFVQDLLHAYLRNGTSEIEAVTRDGYEVQIKSKLIPAFGKMLIRNVTPGDVGSFLEKWKQAGSPVSANRARAALSSAFSYGMRIKACDFNPCHGVRRNTERPSRRYVTNAELQAATDAASPGFALLMQAAYITGLREVDLIKMRRSQLTEEGIEVTESKTTKQRLMLWTDTLRKIVAEAIADGDAKIARRSKRKKQQFALPEHVFVNHRALPWSPSAVCQAMERYDATFTFRELRPKAATDAQHNVLGHTGQMITGYVRREKLTPVK